MSAGNAGSPVYTGVTNRLHSQTIWADCLVHGFRGGREDGIYFFDDFASAQDGGTITTAVPIGDYEFFGDATGTITGGLVTSSTTTTGYRGGLILTSGTTTNDDVIVALGGGAPFVISSTDPKKLWFEARFAVSSVTTDDASIFIGLAEEDRTSAASGAGLFADEDNATFNSAMADIDMIGFVQLSPAATTLAGMYGKAGQTASKFLSSAGTLVAATYVKAGFKYDPKAPASKRIKFYFNGVESSTYVTQTLLTAAAFPDGEEMTMYAGITNSVGTAQPTLTLDWWACAQEG